MKVIAIYLLTFTLILQSAHIFSQNNDFYLTHIRKSQTKEINKKYASDSCFIKDSLMDLALILYANDTSASDYFVILIPGDGGWTGFIEKWAKDFQQKGVAVIGFNTIPYFVKEKKPEVFAKDIRRIIVNFSHVFKKNKVMLGGYSYGAEVIPFAYNCMDSTFQNRIEKMLLVGPSNSASFKVSLNYIYKGLPMKPVLPEILKIDNNKVMIFCDDQKESICKIMPPDNKVPLIWLNAGHLFVGKELLVTSIIGQKIGLK